ncbi:hypothetical protein PX458_000975 [Staphylococcus pseudintermedius]|nr:hypothetical protein [Staphylococcus pseudintermedius]EGQ3599430.1 hypothetical protein [Staphylococcus pseudintermedius]EHB2546757.1 hypothetical protein [Staphylococcus pseudintermedius]EIU0339723.1 hypothetical protein [Staphylococcus pseudintermedius]EJY6914770.1 hypothetical protein [Staphylococcus pseudintermedius]EKO0707497.1 hypothetical protein [Staphylococcus pseudintermedius]
MKKNRTPQDGYFKKVDLITYFLFCAYTFFGIISLIQGFTDSKIILSLSATSVISIFILEKLKDYYFDKGIFNKRVKLLDNAFNQRHEPEEAVFDYYDNDEIDPGMLKLFWNVYESAFFSQPIIAKMLKVMYIYVSILALILLIFLFMTGINIYSLSALVLVFSNAFLNRIYSFTRTNKSIEKILEKSAILADEREKNIDTNYYLRRVIDIIVSYESTMSENKYSLNKKTYSKNRKFLNDEWNELKGKYNKKIINDKI